jgi:hypothetical protein
MVLLFKLIIQIYYQVAKLLAHDHNPITQLWERLGTIVNMNHWLFKWLKIAKLCIVMVLGLTWRMRLLFPTFLSWLHIWTLLFKCTHITFTPWKPCLVTLAIAWNDDQVYYGVTNFKYYVGCHLMWVFNGLTSC